MALANYADLQASVAAWAHRTDLVAIIPDFVTMAEARISRDLRIRKQITSSTLVTVANTQSVALPTDWLEFENVSVATSPSVQLTYVPVEHIDANFSSSYTDTPSCFTIEGDNILFAPTPDAAYNITAIYYARFPSLITNSTNWLMTNHPNIYLFACLIEVYSYLRNADAAQLYLQRYQSELAQLQNVDDRATHSGSALRVKVV
jgi:hypothetical protein